MNTNFACQIEYSVICLLTNLTKPLVFEYPAHDLRVSSALMCLAKCAACSSKMEINTVRVDMHTRNTYHFLF